MTGVLLLVSTSTSRFDLPCREKYGFPMANHWNGLAHHGLKKMRSNPSIFFSVGWAYGQKPTTGRYFWVSSVFPPSQTACRRAGGFSSTEVKQKGMGFHGAFGV